MAELSGDGVGVQRYRQLTRWAVVLTLCLIMLGAWVRLTDAGLGCPDWPGCYGQITPVQAADQISAAVLAQGGEHGPVSMGKAWREMGHRYVAMVLGLFIIFLAWTGWKRRAELPGGPWLATILVAVVVLQGLFGKWTVTLLLRPAIVTGHLIGGMVTLALLTWLWQRQAYQQPVSGDSNHLTNRSLLRIATVVALLALSIQIALGGWTSTNYAALACTDLPTCQGLWWPETDFGNAFHLFRELGLDANGQSLGMSALTAIHLSHRIGAIFAALSLCWLSYLAVREPSTRIPAYWLLAALVSQVLLGFGNVLLSLPLAMAVAHNGGAGILLILIVVIKYRVFR